MVETDADTVGGACGTTGLDGKVAFDDGIIKVGGGDSKVQAVADNRFPPLEFLKGDVNALFAQMQECAFQPLVRNEIAQVSPFTPY